MWRRSMVWGYEMERGGEALALKKVELQSLRKEMQRVEQEIASLEAGGGLAEETENTKFDAEVEKDFKRRRERILKNVEKKEKKAEPEVSPSRGEGEGAGAKANIADVDVGPRRHGLVSSTPAQQTGANHSAALPALRSETFLKDALPQKGQRKKKDFLKRGTQLSKEEKKKKKAEEDPKPAPLQLVGHSSSGADIDRRQKMLHLNIMQTIEEVDSLPRVRSVHSSVPPSLIPQNASLLPPPISVAPSSPSLQSLTSGPLPPPISQPDPRLSPLPPALTSPLPHPSLPLPSPETKRHSPPSPVSSLESDDVSRPPRPTSVSHSPSLLERKSPSPLRFDGSDDDITPPKWPTLSPTQFSGDDVASPLLRADSPPLFLGSDDDSCDARLPSRLAARGEGEEEKGGEDIGLRTASEEWSSGKFDFKGHSSDEEKADLFAEDEDDEVLRESMKMHDWNSRFQQAVVTLRRLPYTDDATLTERADVNQELMHLSHDFIHAAQTYGRIIISEVFLPNGRKTIPPVSLGGVAGGQKYVVHNILFKFALDSAGLFGGDNLAAAKVGGLELKGLVNYFSVEDDELNVPMMALVDYRGFRLIAMCVLPIRGDSLIYGSKDAGNTVHNRDPAFAKRMADAGKRLNLCPHLCGTDASRLVELWSACDIEGHMGEDGKYYLLDFSRTMPPVTPRRDIVQGHLYRLFRKEFVQKYQLPLCADGFSGFCMHDPRYREMNDALKTATHHLLYDLIPEFARYFLSLLQVKDPLTISLPREMHQKGINLRYLGRVHNCLFSRENAMLFGDVLGIARRLMLIEACARVLKNKLNLSLQQKMKELRLPLEVPYRQEVVRLINIWFAEGLESASVWDTDATDGIRESLRRSFEFTFFTKTDPGLIPDDWIHTPTSSFLKTHTNADAVEGRERGKRLAQSNNFSRRSTVTGGEGGDGEKPRTLSSRRSVQLTKFNPETVESGDKSPATAPKAKVESEEAFSLKRYLFFERETFRDQEVGGRWPLFSRFIQLAGLTISDGSSKRFQGAKGWKFNSKEPLSLLDLINMEGRVKHMHIVSAAAGTFFQNKGLTVDQKEFAADHFREAIERYEEALEADPQDGGVMFFLALTWYKLLREMSSSKGAEGRFSLFDIGVQQTKDYFLEALHLNPTNRMALCSFAEFSSQCGDFQTAEEYFLRTLEVDPKYSYALLQYGNFLCRRDLKLVAQMFLEKGGQAAGSQSAIDALTGKQVSGAVGVMFPDNTKKTVNATPAMTSLDLMVSLRNISIHRMGHSESKIETELIDSQFRIIVLHERVGGEGRERDRPLKDTEKPLLLLQQPGRRVELVAHPLRLPPSLRTTFFEHYMDLLNKMVPKSCPMELNMESFLEFENSIEGVGEIVRNSIDPVFRSGQLLNLKKAVVFPNKKESAGWLAFNFTLLSRFALYNYASVSLFCECTEMKINSKGIIAPWMMKGYGVKEDFFLPPLDYATSYKLFFSQFIKTQLSPAIKGTIKQKKLTSELFAVAERLASLLLHTVHAHRDKLKRMSGWELPVLPLLHYAFYFLTENGFLSKKSELSIFSTFQACLEA